MDKKEALKIWEHEFGNVEYAYDFTGRKVKRSARNNQIIERRSAGIQR